MRLAEVMLHYGSPNALDVFSEVGEPSSMTKYIDVSAMFQHMMFELLDFGSPFWYTFGIFWAPFNALLGPIGPILDRPHGPLLGPLNNWHRHAISACRAPLCVSCIKTLNMFRCFSTFFAIA